MEEIDNISSVYIHIPFCSSICSYCDFCKFYYNENYVNKYLEALETEIKDKYNGEVIETIYIGGGTPSFLSISHLTKLFNCLKLINLSSNIEFTFECNVLDLTKEKLIFLKEHGVNRLSIGIQSFQSKKLVFLERNYDKDIILEKLKLAKEYFSNINIDLMYAIPGESLEMLKDDLDLFLSLDISHISTYSLIIEEHTKLFINNTTYISEELDYEMYKLICSTLKKHGYNHYEISNYSLPGYESKHNLTYWKNEKYYGFGISACGYIDNIRYTNTKNIKKYLAGDYIQEKETVTSKIDASNYAILGLRTINGINKQTFLKKFGISFIEYFNIESLLKEKIILENQQSYYLNPKYWYVSNEILVKFV